MIEGEVEKVSWNIAASQSQFVFSLIKKSMLFYQNGNLSKWYWTLTCLREMINYGLKTNARDELDNIEKKVQTSLKYWSIYQRTIENHSDNKMTKEQLYKKNLFAVHVRTYQRKIMDFLKELGFFPSKEDRTKLSF